MIINRERSTAKRRTVVPTWQTVEDLLWDYVATLPKNKKRDQKLNTAVETGLRPFFDKMPPQVVDGYHLRFWDLWLGAHRFESRCVGLLHDTLRNAYQNAVLLGRLSKNPFWPFDELTQGSLREIELLEMALDSLGGVEF